MLNKYITNHNSLSLFFIYLYISIISLSNTNIRIFINIQSRKKYNGEAPSETDFAESHVVDEQAIREHFKLGPANIPALPTSLERISNSAVEVKGLLC